jgi:hypothetical protein
MPVLGIFTFMNDITRYGDINARPAFRMPFLTKCLRLIAAPGDVFGELRETFPSPGNWVLPVLLYVAVATVSIHLMLGQPSLAAHYQQIVNEDLRPTFDQQVLEGIITQQQAEWILLFVTPGTAHFLVAQGVGTTLGALAALFALSFIFWQVGKSAMGGGAPYMSVVEVVGLTFLVAALERIVTAFLTIAMDSIFATPTLGLLALHAGPDSTLFSLLSRVNVFTIWELAVISKGLAVLNERDFPKVFVLLLALWLLWTIVTLLPLVDVT